MAVDHRKSKWFLRTPSDRAARRIFLLPYSGCGASMYRQWPRFIGDIEICPIQTPGRENRMREPAFRTYPDLASALIDELAPHLDRPFGIFGHCGSALAAYETAVQLMAGGGPVPAAVFVSAQVAPQDGPFGTFLDMDDKELADVIRDMVTALGGEPIPELIQLYREVMRGDLEANAVYHVAEPAKLPCHLTAIGWRDDPTITPDMMAGWSQCGDSSFYTLEGGHYEFLQAPQSLLTLMARSIGHVTEQPR
ncbi:thioesterase domain-containing protein [Streptomyces sp. NPDC086077]|uniref:thioesterase II family protein n=1 Tax=Streptomyces sp. NPDC086077 TaxID=3154862 RepID=UPI0034194A2A